MNNDEAFLEETFKKKENTSPSFESQTNKILKKSVNSAKKLHLTIESLDFQIEKFNRFYTSVKSFNTWNSLLLSTISLLIGSVSSFYAVSSYSEYYIESEIEKRNKVYSILDKYSVLVSENKESVQIYTIKTNRTTSFETDKYEVLEIKK